MVSNFRQRISGFSLQVSDNSNSAKNVENKEPLTAQHSLFTKFGFTLIEIMVVIFIVVLSMTFVVSRGGMRDSQKLKDASSHLSTVIRYLYNESATEGKYLRLVMDIGERTYWAESSSEPVLLGLESDEQEKEASDEADEGESASAGGFSKDESRLFKTKKLPDDIYFKDIYTMHLPMAVDSGKVAIYFFPNGYVEEAIINLRNEDDDENYSIKTIPVSGRATIESEYRSLEQ